MEKGWASKSDIYLRFEIPKALLMKKELQIHASQWFTPATDIWFELKQLDSKRLKKIIMPKLRCAYLGVTVSSKILNVTDYSKTYTSSFIDWFFFFWISGSKSWVHLFLQSCNIFLVGPHKTPFLFHFLFHFHFLLTPSSKL